MPMYLTTVKGCAGVSLHVHTYIHLQWLHWSVAGGKAAWVPVAPCWALRSSCPSLPTSLSVGCDCHPSLPSLHCQVAGLLPLFRDVSHRPFTMLWPTDSALQALPPDRQAWLYHEDHRDKLAAILRGHVIRNIEVGTPQILGPAACHPAFLPSSNHGSICSGLGI